MDAVAGRGPDAAGGVEAEAVEQAGVAGGEDAALLELALVGDVEGADVARTVGVVGGAGVGDVEDLLVG